MAQIKVHKSVNFTTISKHHIRNRELSLKAKGLLTLILSLPSDWDYSVIGLTSLSKDGKDAVMSALAELSDAGYICIESFRNDKGQYESVYNVFEEPNRDSRCGKSESGNPIQHNNNIDIVSTKVETTPSENNNPIILFNDKDIPTKETSKERRFVKPTLEQVKAYCEERGNNIDPQHFIDYYESNGWMVGRTHMKDWKAAIRTWERKEVKQLTTPRYGNTINQSGNGVAAAEQPRQRTYTGRF